MQACVAQVILVDANLLIYAVGRDSPHHVPTRRWLEDTLSGSESVGIPWIAALAFARIATDPGIMGEPLAVENASRYIDGWLRQPIVILIGPGEKALADPPRPADNQRGRG